MKGSAATWCKRKLENGIVRVVYGVEKLPRGRRSQRVNTKGKRARQTFGAYKHCAVFRCYLVHALKYGLFLVRL